MAAPTTENRDDSSHQKRNTNTIIIKNLKRTTKNEDLEGHFMKFGELKRCFVVGDKETGDSCKGVGFVTFKTREDAVSVLKKAHTVCGQKVILQFSDSKFKIHKYNLSENFKKKKVAKLIVRNLSFKATEEDLRKTFEKYGNVIKTFIPKKPDGKKLGYGFVEFERAWDATKAVDKVNMTELLGRPVAVDWCIQKNQYVASENDNEEKTGEDNDANEDKPKVKKGKRHDNHDSDDSGNDSEEESEDNSESEDGEDMDDDEEDDSDEEDEEEPKRRRKDEEGPKRRRKEDEEGPANKKKKSLDAEDGCTLFVRNLSFDSTQQSLHDLFATFGDVKYALLCKDRDLDRPKGTAFVRFNSSDSAAKCLEAFTNKPSDFLLDGRPLTVCEALVQSNITKLIQSRKEKEPNDKRNLYLAREGVIFPNTPAAEGVSKHDMMLRQQLQMTKNKALRNVNMFLSSVRLYVQNIPDNINDNRLMTIFAKTVGQAAKITECRVMRNLKQMQANGLGKSKGYGFVTFKKHEDALTALRQLNNNPKIFSKDRRPIVEFSIEDHMAIMSRQRRLERSKLKVKGSSAQSKEPAPARPKDEEVTEPTQGFQGAAANHRFRNLKRANNGPPTGKRPKKLSRKFLRKMRSKKRGQKLGKKK